MKKIVVVLVTIIICRIAFLGGYVGYQQYQSTTYNTLLKQSNNSTNQTSNNQLSNQNNEQVNRTGSSYQTTDKNIISANEAINIVKQSVPAYGKIRYKAYLVKNDQNPYYQVDVYQNDPTKPLYGQVIGGAQVDAKTGEFLGGMG